LSLSNNKLRKIPNKIIKLTKLESLTLLNNSKLNYFPINIFDLNIRITMSESKRYLVQPNDSNPKIIWYNDNKKYKSNKKNYHYYK
jgi:Leucine-rich repeat (LRR) protein